MRQHRRGGRSNQREVDVITQEVIPEHCPGFARTDIGVTTPYRLQADKAADLLDQIEADTIHKFQGRQKKVVILSTVLDETWRGRTGLTFVDDPQMINVAVSRAIRRFILVTNNDMLPTSRHIRDLVGYIRYHNPGEEVVDSAVVSVFDLLYREYSQRLKPLAARLRKELKYKSEDIIWTVLHEILAEERYVHLSGDLQVLVRNLIPDLSRLTPAGGLCAESGLGRLRRLQPDDQPSATSHRGRRFRLPREQTGPAGKGRDQGRDPAGPPDAPRCGCRPRAAARSNESARHSTTPKLTGLGCRLGEATAGKATSVGRLLSADPNRPPRSWRTGTRCTSCHPAWRVSPGSTRRGPPTDPTSGIAPAPAQPSRPPWARRGTRHPSAWPGSSPRPR